MRTKLFKSLAVTGAIAFTAGVMGACSSGEKSIPTIDLIGNMNHEDVGDLDDIFEMVDVISPELTDSTILRNPRVGGFSDGVIYLSDENRNSTRMMAFDVKTGKCLASFDHTGLGPGEYRLYYDAIFKGTPSHWTGLDTFYRRVTSYTADGELIESWPDMGIICLNPNGDGWIAVDNDLSRNPEDPIRLIRFDAKFNVSDTIETNIPRDYWSLPLIYPLDDDLQLFTNDTLYSFADIDNPRPILAFNTNNLKAPKNHSGNQTWKDRLKHLSYFFIRYGSYVVVDNKYNGKNVVQIYDIRNGKLLYSRSCIFDADTYKILEGDIGKYLTVDGVKSKWLFLPSRNNNIFILQHEEDVDEDTANPKIVRLQIKDR